MTISSATPTVIVNRSHKFYLCFPDYPSAAEHLMRALVIFQDCTITLVSTPPSDFQSTRVIATRTSSSTEDALTLERARILTKSTSADLLNNKLSFLYNSHEEATAALALLTEAIPSTKFTRTKPQSTKQRPSKAEYAPSNRLFNPHAHGEDVTAILQHGGVFEHIGTAKRGTSHVTYSSTGPVRVDEKRGRSEFRSSLVFVRWWVVVFVH
jgi:hypothetical protein